MVRFSEWMSSLSQGSLEPIEPVLESPGVPGV